jgi:hypothetical protein
VCSCYFWEKPNEQAEHIGDVPTDTGLSGGKGKILTSSSTGQGYSRLEQKKHKKSRGTAAWRESLQKREGKKLDEQFFKKEKYF